MLPANAAANSTQGMPLPTAFEQEESRFSNKGKHPTRAGGRALSNTTRKERADKEEKRLEKLHAADIEAESRTAIPTGGKRKRENESPTEELPRIKRTKPDLAG